MSTLKNIPPHTAIIPKIFIFLVKLSERLAEDKHINTLDTPIDIWTIITYITSFSLGYIYPNDLPFFMSTILFLDIIKHRISGEYIIMYSASSILGYISGIFFRTGIFI